MMLIFALGAVFGGCFGAFTLALLQACSDYNQEKAWRKKNPPPDLSDRQPGRHMTPEDGQHWQTRGR